MGRRRSQKGVEHTVEKILDSRVNMHGYVEYLIKWEGYPLGDSSWVVAQDVNAPKLIEEMEQRKREKEEKEEAARREAAAVVKASKAIDHMTPSSSPVPAEKQKEKKKGEKKGKKEEEQIDTLSTLMDRELTMVDPLESRKIAKPKKRVKRVNEDTESEAVREQPDTWFDDIDDGIPAAEELSVETLRFNPRTYFIGKYRILNLVELDQTKGATYIAYRHSTEIILRMNYIQNDGMEMVTTEAKFLEMMELNDVQGLFSTIYDMGVVNKEQPDGVAYYSVIYRGGPTLQQCRTFCEERSGSLLSQMRPGTVDRLASRLVKILEQIFGQGYSILSFSLDDFKIDHRSRLAFLQTYKNIVKAEVANVDEDVEEEEEETDGAMKGPANVKKRRQGWEGHPDLAPLSWHLQGDDHVMSEMDSIESLVYLLIQLQRGRLPWAGEIEKCKLKMAHGDLSAGRGRLINCLQPSLKCLWAMVRGEAADSPRVNFDDVFSMLSKYVNANEDYIFDWEYSQPPPETTERLVALSYEMEDAKTMLRVANCIFENEATLARR